MARAVADSALARAVNDPAAFGEFYEANAKQLVVFFTRRILDAEMAVDLTAETFAQAFVGRRSFRGQTHDSAQAWLYAIAHRQLARYLRKGYADRRMRDRLGLELPAADADELRRIEQLAGTEELRRALAHSLEALPADQRRALQLRIVDERPYPEVASEMAISEQAARARVSRALRALRSVLAPLAEGGDLA